MVSNVLLSLLMCSSLPVSYTEVQSSGPSGCITACVVLTACVFLTLQLHQDDCACLQHYTLREKRVPKRCPWGTIATNGTFFSKGNSAPFNLSHLREVRVLYYGQSNSAPRGTVLVPFFLSVT